MKKWELTSTYPRICLKTFEESLWNSRKMKIESEIAVAKSEDSFENSWNDQASYWKSYVRTCVNWLNRTSCEGDSLPLRGLPGWSRRSFIIHFGRRKNPWSLHFEIPSKEAGSLGYLDHCCSLNNRSTFAWLYSSGRPTHPLLPIPSSG